MDHYEAQIVDVYSDPDFDYFVGGDCPSGHGIAC
jgi:hypothetical protein